MTTEEKKWDILKKHAEQLQEHFDSVLILINSMQEDRKSSYRGSHFCGNILSLKAQAEMWSEEACRTNSFDEIAPKIKNLQKEIIKEVEQEERGF